MFLGDLGGLAKKNSFLFLNYFWKSDWQNFGNCWEKNWIFFSPFFNASGYFGVSGNFYVSRWFGGFGNYFFLLFFFWLFFQKRLAKCWKFWKTFWNFSFKFFNVFQCSGGRVVYQIVCIFHEKSIGHGSLNLRGAFEPTFS